MSLTFRDTKGAPLTAEEGDANIRTLNASIGAVASGKAQPGRLSCFQRQRFIVPSGKSILASAAPGAAGLITSIWFANAGDGDAGSLALRVDGDYAFFGANGATVAQWFCQGAGQKQVYRSTNRGVSYSDGSAFGGFLKHQIPFGSDWQLEYTSPNAAGTTQTWVMVEYTDSLAGFELPATYRAKAQVVTQAMQWKNLLTLADSPTDCVLAGFYAIIQGSGSDNYYNEGDVRVYYDQESTESYRSSGFEDVFDSSYYFQKERTFLGEYEGVVSNAGDTGAYQLSYKFWPLARAPRGAAGLKATFTLGDPDYAAYAPAGTEQVTFVVFTYEAASGTALAQRAPTLTGTAGNAAVYLSFSSTQAGAVFQVERSNGSGYDVLYTGLNTAYSDGGRTNGTAYVYRAKVLAAGNRTGSAYASVTVTPSAAAPVPWQQGQSVDDDDTGAWDYSNGNWQASANISAQAGYNDNSLHFLPPGYDGVAMLYRLVSCAAIRIPRLGGAGDQYDVLCDGAVLQTVAVTTANQHALLDIPWPSGIHRLSIRGVAGYQSYATIDQIQFV